MSLLPFRALKFEKEWDLSPLLSDGGIGTELLRRGVDRAELLSVNLNEPDTVLGVHRSYISAGSDIITSNTFGLQGNLTQSNFASSIRRGIELAIQAARESNREIAVWISLAGFNASDVLAIQDIRFEEIEGLESTGILLETCTSLKQAARIMTEIASHPSKLSDCPIVASFHFLESGKTPDGDTVEEIILAIGKKVFAIGGNCGFHPNEFVTLTQQFRRFSGSCLTMQPNAGLPIQTETGELKYQISPEEFSRSALEITSAGANIIGGCCGTTPAHIAELHKRLSSR